MPVRRHPMAQSNEHLLLDPIPLDVALIARLQQVYQVIREGDLKLATIFYDKLFAAHPNLRGLFPDDLKQQAGKLVATLDSVFGNLERPEANARMLAELGIRHVQYGATPEHYDVVVDLLVSSMEELLGPAAPVQVIVEWRTALRLISDQMIAAAHGNADRAVAP